MIYSVSLQFDKVYGINNGYFIRKGFRCKKKESQCFEDIWKSEFLQYKKSFQNYFDESKHFLDLELYWHNPKFYKKNSNEINKRAGDIDGIEKFVIDGICKGLGIDDSFLKSKKISQLPTQNNKHSISAIVEIGNLISLCG